jgi:HAD superfamily hydrolase (TIGR01509 family)
MALTQAGDGRRGVLFDVDGTLVDSGYIHAVCWWQAFRQQDRDVPMSLIHRSVGMGADRLVPHVLNDADVDDDLIAELTASHDALYSTYWPQLRPLPGAVELVRRCHEAGLVTVLASSAGATELAVLRQVLDVDDCIDEATSSADGDNSKPEPDLVLAALDKAGLAAEDAIFLGDAVWDVKASAQAGIDCVGVECGGTSEAELREAGAIAVYRDAADLLANWEQSPLNAS